LGEKKSLTNDQLLLLLSAKRCAKKFLSLGMFCQTGTHLFQPGFVSHKYMRFRFTFLALCLCSLLSAQVEKVYDDREHLQTINPINQAGMLDGGGSSFHPSGAIAKETPFVEGRIEGEEKEFDEMGRLVGKVSYRDGLKEGWYLGYYPSGKLRMKQGWKAGKRQGNMLVYYSEGALKMFAVMDQDTIQFAQHFDPKGKLTNEKVGFISQALDTTLWEKPRIFLAEADHLRSDQPTPARVVVPGVPTEFIRFYSPDGEVGLNQDPAYPLLLYPKADASEFTLYLQIKTHTTAQPAVLQHLNLSVQ